MSTPFVCLIALTMVVCIIITALIINRYTAAKNKACITNVFVEEKDLSSKNPTAPVLEQIEIPEVMAYNRFLADLETIFKDYGRGGNTLLKTIQLVLDWTQMSIDKYNKDFSDNTFTPHRCYYTNAAFEAILHRAPMKDWGEGVVTALKFVEKNFPFTGLMAVAYRHKNQVSFDDRTRGLLKFTIQFIRPSTKIASFGNPADCPLLMVNQLSPKYMIDARVVSKDFHLTAIDGGFMPHMAKAGAAAYFQQGTT